MRRRQTPKRASELSQRAAVKLPAVLDRMLPASGGVTQFCGVFPYKAHVQLSFARGVDLDDPDGLLEGSGKFRRHLTFKSLDDVDAKVVKRSTKAASKLGAG